MRAPLQIYIYIFFLKSQTFNFSVQKLPPPQMRTEGRYLPGCPVLLQRHRVVVLVFPPHAPGTHADLVGAAVELQQAVVEEAQVTFQVRRGRDQPVLAVPAKLGVVEPQVGPAEGQDAQRARLDRRGGLPPAHAALHLRGRRGAGPLGAGLQELLHHLAEDGVSAQQGFGVERLPALRAAVLALGLSPEVLDAAQAVAVSAGDGHRLPQHLQAHRAAELLLLHRDGRGCHFGRKSSD